MKLPTKVNQLVDRLFTKSNLIKLSLALVSFAIFTFIFSSWLWALVFMGSMVFHELGHIQKMKQYGLKIKGMYFIPFMGLVAVSQSAWPSRQAEADIALEGPLWGLILALATYFVFLVMGSPFVAIALIWMALLNLFNLLPLNPLDGGRVVKSVLFSLSPFLGMIFLFGVVIALVVGAILLRAPLLALIAFAGYIELKGEVYEWRRKTEPKPAMKVKNCFSCLVKYIAIILAFTALFLAAAKVPEARAFFGFLFGNDG